jgi:hypothetical protein
MHEKMTKIINQILEVDNDIDDSSDSGDPVFELILNGKRRRFGTEKYAKH